MTIEQLIDQLPDYAKDIKLNFSSILSENGADDLSQKQIYQIALAAAYTTKNINLISVLAEKAADYLSPNEMNGMKAAASIMSMNNIYYRFIHLVSDKTYASMPAKLRMNIIANHGINKLILSWLALRYPQLTAVACVWKPILIPW